MTISRMRRHAPFWPTDPSFCLWGGVADVINCAKVFENRFRGSGAGRPSKMAFPIESVHRPYNSAALPRRLWSVVSDKQFCLLFHSLWSKCPPSRWMHDLRRRRYRLIAQSVIFWSNFCHSSTRRVWRWLMSRMCVRYTRCSSTLHMW